jgi:hypothetical protein
VIEWGYDQVAGAQVPKWRREIEAQEQAKKEREKAQLEDYIFRLVFSLCYAFSFLNIFSIIYVVFPVELVWREIEAGGVGKGRKKTQLEL